jgi:site-specific recombinase
MPDSTTADLVREALPEERRGHADSGTLARLFSAAVDATDPVARMDAWVDLLLWSRIGRDLERSRTGAVVDTTRFRTLISLVERSPALEVRFSTSFAALLAASDGTALFAEAGIPGNRGFLAEAGERLADGVLPEPHDPSSLVQIVRHLFPSRVAIDRLRGQGPGPLQRAAAVLVAALPAAAWDPLRVAFTGAIRLLHVRIVAQGLAPNLRARSLPGPIDASPFHRLQRAGEELLAAVPAGDAPGALLRWRREVSAVEAGLAEIRRQIEDEGVSVDIVYGIEVIRVSLARLQTMVAILMEPPGEERSALIHALLAELAEGCLRDRSLVHLAGTSLRLLHRKIVERAGRTGEHYVAMGRREYLGIWLAAAGGGLVTVFTAAGKTAIAGLKIALFLSGLLAGLNYAASFLILHHCHLVLATKQPAMTAATLAGIIRAKRGGERLDEIVDFTAAIVASQLAAACANIAVVTIGAYAFDLAWTAATGHHWLSVEKARATYDEFSPVSSLTVWYAAFTGVILWLSSLAGGWLDNWSTYHRLPQGLRDLGRRAGGARFFGRLGDGVERNLAGWGTNVALGMMLGLVPVLGDFLGLPLHVRHVTLSTGTLSLAAAGLGSEWSTGGAVLLAISGIAVMFVLNLGVSFSLSLFTALRAYELPRGEVLDLLRRLGARAARRPLDFLLPPRRRPAGAAAPHHG